MVAPCAASSRPRASGFPLRRPRRNSEGAAAPLSLLYLPSIALSLQSRFHQSHRYLESRLERGFCEKPSPKLTKTQTVKVWVLLNFLSIRRSSWASAADQNAKNTHENSEGWP